jgi:hypothetical protein
MLPHFVRFKDLKARGIVTSWPQLQRMQQEYGFPTGRLLGANMRAWTVEEVEEWLSKCPFDPSPASIARGIKGAHAKVRTA